MVLVVRDAKVPELLLKLGQVELALELEGVDGQPQQDQLAMVLSHITAYLKLLENSIQLPRVPAKVTDVLLVFGLLQED